jgi:EmrB/QacA subfamily drug resistance transporter
MRALLDRLAAVGWRRAQHAPLDADTAVRGADVRGVTPPSAPAVAFGTARGRWLLTATVFGSAMAAIDGTVVGIALPTIGREFHATFATLQWVATGYTLTLAALLLLGGALGDRFGRRRVFLIGVVWFTLASLACALAPGTDALIATRTLQGVGAALLTPGSLAILQASFEREDRGRAIGAWSGLGGVATAAGPLLGGYLITTASWRWIFVINLPVGAFVLWISRRHVPESSDPHAPRRLDVAGAAIAVVALAGVAFGLIEGPTRGWSDPAVLVAIVVGALAVAAFVVVERRAAAPMLPIAFFAERRFSVTNAVTFAVYAALGGVLFLLPVQLQVVDGYTALESGLALIPLTLIMLLLSARSGRLAARIGPRLQMSVGPLVIGLGLALLGRAATHGNYGIDVLPGVVVLGLGLAATVAPLTATALGALPEGHEGLASAVNNDVARLGGLIAVAVLPALSGITGDAYLHPARLAEGFRTAVLVAAGCCAVAGALAAIGLRAARPAAPVPVAAATCFHCALDGAPLVTQLAASGAATAGP